MKNSSFTIFISSSCSKKNRIGEAVGELAELGFKNIELTGGTIFYDGIENDLDRLKKEYGLNYLVHNYFPPPKEDFVLNVASRRTDNQDKALALVREALSLAQKFDKNLYTMHPGFTSEVLPELKDGFFIKEENVINSKNDFFKNLEILSEEVVSQDFRIGIENLGIKTADDKFSFLCDDGDIEYFLEYFKNNKRIGMLLDLGHLNVVAQILRFDRNLILNKIVDNFSDKVFAFHLSENNGIVDLHGVVPLNSWQLKFLIKHRKIFNSVPIVFEWHDAASRQVYEHYKAIEEMLN